MEYLQRILISFKQGGLIYIYIYEYIQYLHIIIHLSLSLKWPRSTVCLSWILSMHKSVCLFCVLVFGGALWPYWPALRDLCADSASVLFSVICGCSQDRAEALLWESQWVKALLYVGHDVTYCLGIKLVIITYTAFFLWVRFKINTNNTNQCHASIY